jgi:hypothetical protein
MTELVFLQPGGPGKSAYSEGTVWGLARALSRVSAMDPAEVLKRLSAGDELLPKFAAESIEDEVALPAFRDLVPARLGKLTEHEYESFLAGMAPSAIGRNGLEEDDSRVSEPNLTATRLRSPNTRLEVLAGVSTTLTLLTALGATASWFMTDSNWALVATIGGWGALLVAAALLLMERRLVSKSRQLTTHQLDLANAMVMAEHRDERRPLRDHTPRNM